MFFLEYVYNTVCHRPNLKNGSIILQTGSDLQGLFQSIWEMSLRVFLRASLNGGVLPVGLRRVLEAWQPRVLAAGG